MKNFIDIEAEATIFSASDNEEIELQDLKKGQEIRINYLNGDIISGEVVELKEDCLVIYLEMADALFVEVNMNIYEIDNIELIKDIEENEENDDEE